MSGAPADSLIALAALLRADDTVISPHVTDPAEAPALGPLAAAGPRAADAPGDYALIIEAVREGYLLHYDTPRILAGADGDLALLAGDYLYATGLARLAKLGDLTAVHELSDLISLSAHIHGEAPAREEPEALAALAGALWLAAAVAVGSGPSERHEAAKVGARERSEDAAGMLVAAAEAASEAAGSRGALGEARDAIGLPSSSTYHS